MPPARLFDETLKLFLTGHGAMSLVVLQRHGLLAELLPTVASYLNRHPDGAVSRAGAPGTRQHRSARGCRQTGDADLPVRAAAVRTVRRDHREAAAGEVARHRHDRRCRGPRGAPGAGPHFHSEAFLAGRARNVRGAAAPRATARPARAAHARTTALPRRLRPAAAARRHGAGLARARGLVDEGPGSFADRSRSHGRCAGAAAASGRRWGRCAPWPAPSPSAWSRAAHPRPHERRAAEVAVASSLAGCRPTSAWAATSPIRERRWRVRSRRLGRLSRLPPGSEFAAVSHAAAWARWCNRPS